MVTLLLWTLSIGGKYKFETVGQEQGITRIQSV